MHHAVGTAGTRHSPVGSRYIGRCTLAAKHVKPVRRVAGDIVLRSILLPDNDSAQRPKIGTDKTKPRENWSGFSPATRNLRSDGGEVKLVSLDELPTRFRQPSDLPRF